MGQLHLDHFYLDNYLEIQAQAPLGSGVFFRTWSRHLPLFQAKASRQNEEVILDVLSGEHAPEIVGDVEAPYTSTLRSDTALWLPLVDVQSLPLASRLLLARALVRALVNIHANDVFHLALRPSVFLLSRDLSHAEIVDFSSARHCPKPMSGVSAFKPVLADAHFLAPEQMHSAADSVDSRTDLYALGSILYWLFAGVVPFAELSDEAEIAYAQVSRRQLLQADDCINHKCPPALNDILQRLLQKAPDKRYQSAVGLLHDLEQLGSNKEAFRLGQQDISDRLHFPQRLYGREQEVAQLLDAFDRVAEGPSEAVLIGGYSGVGKTALVREIQAPVRQRNGIFVGGKFDQYQRSTPYAAFESAFSDFLRNLLARPEQEIAEWRARLTDVLKPNAQVLVELFPELGRLLGPQPALPPLGADEQQNRFNRTFLRFVREICESHRPLVIFIDDLQWADPGSIQLIKLLLTDPASHYCLVIGAFRDNEVDERHPFARMLRETQAQTQGTTHLNLSPLSATVVTQFLADTLGRGADDIQALSLAVYRKTQGNPFFLKQFLLELYRSQGLSFDYDVREWNWSEHHLQLQHMTDNVVELMLHRIDRLPANTRQLLCQASCIGAHVPLPWLQALYPGKLPFMRTALANAFSSGLLVPVRQQQDELDMQVMAVRFLHDRVQQAAYSMVPDSERVRLHHQVGRVMLETLDEAGVEEHCFELVAHLNLAQSCLSAAERLRLAELNCRAAEKAKSATAYAPAAAYLQEAMSLFVEPPVAVRLGHLECLYLSGDYEHAEQVLKTLEQYCVDTESRVLLGGVLITQYTRFGELNRAIGVGLKCLEALGWPLPPEPGFDDVAQAIGSAQAALLQRDFDQLLAAPEITDQMVLWRMDILMAMQPSCYNSGSLLFPLTILGLFKLTHEHGNSPYASYVYMMYGLLCTKVLKDYDTAFVAAAASDTVQQRYPTNPLLLGRLLMMRSNFILPWQASLGRSAEIRQQAYQQCLEQGDYYWGVHSFIFGFYAELFVSTSLQTLAAQNQQVTATCEQIHQSAQVYLSTLQGNLIRILQGELDNRHNLDHQPGYEEEAYAHYCATHYMCGRYDRLLGRLLQGYLFGNYRQALAVSLNPELGPNDLDEGIYHEAVYTLFNLLCIIAVQRESEEKPLLHLQAWYDAAWEKYRRWYAINPESFAAGYFLIKAEQHALAGQALDAFCNYEKAAYHAGEAGMALLQGLAYERAGLYRATMQQPTLARASLEQAIVIYRAWGADAKAEDLDIKLGQMLPHYQSVASHLDDWSSVVSASQDLSRPLSRERLIERVLQRICEATGARRGVFYHYDEAEWQPSGLYEEGCLQPVSNDQRLLPGAMLNYAKNSARTLVLHDATHRGDFVADSYVARWRPCSVLSLPLNAQESFIGVIHLEHDESSDLFGPRQVRVAELLSAQFAISYQNAGYYELLTQQNAVLEQTVELRTAEIRQKQQQLEGVLQALPSPFFICDLTGEMHDGNAIFRQRFVTAEQAFSVRQMFCQDEDFEALVDLVLQDGGTVDFEAELATSDGTVVWGLFSASVIDVADGRHLFATISDITQSKARESLLHEQATRDALTGTLNRRAFFQGAEQYRSAAPGKAYAVAMLDLDHFKKLNDQYGHAAGDDVLKLFVQTVQQHLREEDLLGRTGGEEFALVLVDVDLPQALNVLQRIAQKCAQQVLPLGDQAIQFTTSGGVVGWQRKASLTQALKLADEALYRAKAEGRNRICAY